MSETFHAGPNLGQLSDVTIIHGDCIEAMRELADNSVDAIVTDPPYGLSATDLDHVIEALTHWLAGDRAFVPDVKGGGFMGKSWDNFVPPPAVWDECFRVLKPGGHLLSFAGTRTIGLMEMSIRLAGFDIRDSIAWLMGSGFPKSRNVSRDLDNRRCRCDAVELNRATTPQIEHNVSDVRSSDVPQAEGVVGGSRAVLLPSVSEPSAPANGYQARAEVRSGQPGLEGWSDLQAAEGELHRTALCPLSPGVPADGTGGRLHHGAPSSDGAVDRAVADSSGMREPHQPQPTGQPQGEPGVVPHERGSQARGSWPVCDRCSQPVVPDGLGTALKPAFEPVVVGRKPFKGNVAANVLTHGTGALNIDGCRIGMSDADRAVVDKRSGAGRDVTNDIYGAGLGRDDGERFTSAPAGRWPANVVLDESQAAALDEQSGYSKSPASTGRGAGGQHGITNPRNGQGKVWAPGDEGGASRFFYCAKAPKRERPVVDGVAHPTVKPLALMRWLVRLVTPPGGVVLDPFAGSGTTVEAVLLEGFRVVGIEREADYLPMIQQRIARTVNK